MRFSRTVEHAEAVMAPMRGALTTALCVAILAVVGASRAAAQPAFFVQREHIDQMLYLARFEGAAEVRQLAYQLHAAYLEQAQLLALAEKEELGKMRPPPPDDQRAVERWWDQRAEIVAEFAARQRALRSQLVADLCTLGLEAAAPQLLDFIERQGRLALSIGGAGSHVDILKPWTRAGQPLTPAFQVVYSEYASRVGAVLASRDTYRAAKGELGPRSPIYAAIRFDAEAKRLHDEYARRLAGALEGLDRVRFEDAFLSLRHGAYFGNTRADALLTQLFQEKDGPTERLMECRARLHAAGQACVDAEERVLEGQVQLGHGRSYDDIVPLDRHHKRVLAERDQLIHLIGTELEAILEERKAP